MKIKLLSAVVLALAFFFGIQLVSAQKTRELRTIKGSYE